MLGHFQSGPTEGEFGVFRQDSGGNFYISYEQIISSMTLRRIKLFDKLDMPSSNDHFNDECCNRDLTDKEIDVLDKIPSSSDLSEVESSTLYYISGYVASKLNIGLDAPETQRQFQPSEFTQKVSRGLLKHPTEDLYELAMTLFAYYKNVDDKSCSNILLKAFVLIYESSPCYLDVPTDASRRLVNCFAKGYSNQRSEEIKVNKQNRKKRKERQFRHT